jgi:hypothetical protein
MSVPIQKMSSTAEIANWKEIAEQEVFNLIFLCKFNL